MTNPDNIVRVRARNGGRASVYEANGWAQAFSTGVLDGNGVVENTTPDMTVLVGGTSNNPDVLIATNPAGYKIALDLVGQTAVTITTPASNKRISAIVAYTDDLAIQSTEDTVTGSPASCGLIVVNGTAASSPSAPTDTQIRNAITADGATGSQASYCVLATVLVQNDTTSITNSLITKNNAGVTSNNIDFTTMPNVTVAFTADSYNLTTDWQNVSDAIGNVPVGTYVAMFFCDVHHTDGLVRNIVARVNTSTGYYSEIGVFNTFTEATSYWNHLCGFSVIYISSDSTVRLQFKGEASWSMNQIYGRFMIFRLK